MPTDEIVEKDWQLQDLCSGKLRESIEALPADLLEMAEEDLVAKAKPTDIHWELRHRFWLVFHEMMNNPDIQNKVMSPAKIYTGICCKKVWQNVLKKPAVLAFIIRPINDFDTDLDTLFAIAQRRMGELIRLSLSPDENFDPNKAHTVVQMIRMIQDRRIGQSVQRSLSLNVSKKMPTVSPAVMETFHQEYEQLTTSGKVIEGDED